MKKGMCCLCYLAVAVGLLLAPGGGRDVGSLRPVEALALYREGETFQLETDTGDWGEGRTAREAVENLEESSPGVIYWETAAYLLLGPGTEEWVAESGEGLNPEIRLIKVKGKVDMKDATAFLAVHPAGIKWKQWSPGMELPTLTEQGRRIILKKDEKGG